MGGVGDKGHKNGLGGDVGGGGDGVGAVGVTGDEPVFLYMFFIACCSFG